jgi:phosphopantetheinyl transferase
MVKIFYTDVTNYQFNLRDLSGICIKRQDYIKSISDEKRRNQSLLVWRLLEFVVNSFYTVENADYGCENNVWFLNNNSIKFSLSHSNNIVAVGVATETNVGVDVERLSEKILKIKSKFDCADIKDDDLIKFLTTKWTEKESLYKSKCDGNFKHFFVKDLNDNEYCITACSNDTDVNLVCIDIKKIIV